MPILHICNYAVRFASYVMVGLVLIAGASAQDPREQAMERLGNDLKYLSSDELEGRNVGSQGIARAGEFIAQRFLDLGLRTDSFQGSPYQEFTIPGPAAMGSPESNTLAFAGANNAAPLVLGKDFTPVSLGDSGKFDAPIVFAGYGITAPDLNYDDYAGVDVEGKVVVIVRKEPGQRDPNSKFEGNRSSQYAYFSSKELNAALHKAAALIIVNDRLTVASAGEDQLVSVTGAGSAVTDNKIPTIFALRSAIDPLLQQALGKGLDDLELLIDSDQQPRSQPLSGISASGETQIEQSSIPVRNVVGLLPGSGALAEQYVVVGAHYDHVGMGGPGSLAPGTIEIHNGADDNASGTTTLLEIARQLSSEPAESRRGVIFIAFTGEEKGLLGSKHYVRSPRWPIEDTVAMVNLDMVGRLDSNTLTVYGTGTATNFDSLIERANQTPQFTLDKEAAGFGPSDHSSFYEADIPVFHFFTGLHNDYHRPGDDFEKVNLEGMARIASMVTDVVRELATAPERPELIKSSAIAQIGQPSGRRARPRAVLGIQLDIASRQAAVAQVPADSPAATAGLQPADVITGIDEDPVDSIGDLRRILAGKQPGDTISVRVLRDSQTLTLSLTLGEG